ncbi:hypothetical protein AEST_20270 [Alishewanella aestuarii B11]|uniref:Uncharacterized protein n=1 Tax=Alishewanella aestuarii B11 TaxID=1197174 RepID=J1YAU3_9ALTE|nr:hypothetical protein [Alishewanella aestuarii]EJI84925.1 hypothetical protein AEST_20270 [Alishewanella aestuarii B11]
MQLAAHFQAQRSTDAYYADFICRDQTSKRLFCSKSLLNHHRTREKGVKIFIHSIETECISHRQGYDKAALGA